MTTTPIPRSGPTTTSPGQGTVRVTLRELREISFRSLVAVGAHPGEAAFAAEQIVSAELGRGTGLRALVDDLEAPWPPSGVTYASSSNGAWTVRVLELESRRTPLRCGALVVDLAAASPDRTLVVAPGVRDPDHLLDHALLTAAAANDVVLAVLPSGASGDALLASADGDLVEVDPPTLLDAPGLAPLPAGLVVFRPTSRPSTLRAEPATLEQRRASRRSAADHGLQVDARQWHVAYAASRRYLVEGP